MAKKTEIDPEIKNNSMSAVMNISTIGSLLKIK